MVSVIVRVEMHNEGKNDDIDYFEYLRDFYMNFIAIRVKLYDEFKGEAP